jgi:hypothetical protein
MKQRFKCPCCGYETLSAEPPGTYEICPTCYWEDDDVQFRDANFEGSANKLSLNQAKENFVRIGVSDPQFKDKVRPPPA